MSVQTLCYLALDAVECTTADEQDVACVDVYIVLVGVLASTLWRHVHHCSLEQLEQSLLHTLTAHVACDARVVCFARYLVYLVDEDDASLRCLHVVVSHLQQAREYALHVLAHVSRLGEHRSVDDGERHLQQLCYGACEQRLARTGRTDHDDVALLYLHAVVGGCLLDSLIVVVYRHGEIALRLVLSDDILVEVVFYLMGLWNFHGIPGTEIVLILTVVVQQMVRLEDVECLCHAMVADVAVHTRDKELHIVLPSAAEGTHLLFSFSHIFSLPFYFLVSTVSIIPYSRASSAVIQ